MWFPKKKSNLLNALLRPINDTLGGAYLVLVMSSEGYRLVPTELRPERFRGMAVTSPLKYAQMEAYLNGLYNGLCYRRDLKKY